MKTVFYLHGKKISRKKAEEMLGKERLATRIKEAKEIFREDPLIEIGWMDRMVIKFR